VSVRPAGDPVLGKRCEIKNVNSLRSLGRAIEYEARRQIDLLEAGDTIRQETRHWDEEGGRTRPGRSKEDSEDYRYFQEPDLVPLDPTAEQLDAIRATMPLLPAGRRQRLAAKAGVAPQAVALHVERGLDDLAHAAIEAGGDPARVLNHVEHNLAVDGAADLDPSLLAQLVNLEFDGKLTATQAKTVLADMVASGRDPESIARERGFEAMDSDALESIVDGVIAANGASWSEFVEVEDGDKKLKKLKGFFTGAVMKESKGQADGRAVDALLLQRRAEAQR